MFGKSINLSYILILLLVFHLLLLQIQIYYDNSNDKINNLIFKN